MINCKFENGGEANLRHVVVDALVVERGKILLVKRAPHLSNGGKYGLIGGFMDLNETLEEAVKREALEETGYKVEIVKLLGVVDNPYRKNDDRQNVAFVFLTKPIKKIRQETDSESTEIGWFDLKKLPREEEFAFDHYEMVKRYLLSPFAFKLR